MKNDHKLVASKQEYEISYISYRYQIPKSAVKMAMKLAGRSRKKIYDWLRRPENGGYKIKTKAFR